MALDILVISNAELFPVTVILVQVPDLQGNKRSAGHDINGCPGQVFFFLSMFGQVKYELTLPNGTSDIFVTNYFNI